MGQLHDPIEFIITRNPETRVIFAEYDHALIQVLTGGRPCHFVGTEHRLWLFGRTFSHAVDDAFAEQATERGRSQASRVCVLQDRMDELLADLEEARRRHAIELAVRARLEKELTSRDGFTRAQRKLSAILDSAAAAASHEMGAPR